MTVILFSPTSSESAPFTFTVALASSVSALIINFLISASTVTVYSLTAFENSGFIDPPLIFKDFSAVFPEVSFWAVPTTAKTLLATDMD